MTDSITATRATNHLQQSHMALFCQQADGYVVALGTRLHRY